MRMLFLLLPLMTHKHMIKWVRPVFSRSHAIVFGYGCFKLSRSWSWPAKANVAWQMSTFHTRLFQYFHIYPRSCLWWIQIHFDEIIMVDIAAPVFYFILKEHYYPCTSTFMIPRKHLHLLYSWPHWVFTVFSPPANIH